MSDLYWRYIVREWRRDGPREYLVIVPNGCTDNAVEAWRLCQASIFPRHVWDTAEEAIVMSNYS